MLTALIVLAAGRGTRMNSDLPKVLHPLGGVPLLVHAVGSGRCLSPDRVVLVTGTGSDAVAKSAKALDPEIDIVIQTRQLGTGHAVLQAEAALKDFSGDAVVLYGDTPFIREGTLRRMKVAREAGHDIVVLGFESAKPGRYGRIVMDGGRLVRIVEFRDATETERTITLCNSGIVMADAERMFGLCRGLSNENAGGEYYLTDIVERARVRGLKVTAVICDERETLGVNTRAQLAHAEAVFQANARKGAMDSGVTMVAPDTVFLSYDTRLGPDCLLEPNVILGPGVTVEAHATIRAFSHLEGAHIGRGAVVGPFARLRPGTNLSSGAKVGNFVEIKNASLGEGAKAGHLAYVGDAQVGPDANIGAGTVTCNYNGVEKHRTEIGARAFIGSDTMLVAPVRVGDDAITASGSVITKDVPDGALAITRADQNIKPGATRRLLELYRRSRAKSGKP
ncbi:MAG: bifunctional UDP-N-acetylglucosamine diphosphorylase/glucosamine-1-phosphate N-acetyltransferase GlmU [Rhodobacter sp.]|nr:bifunctional UDP-N-acetylglucosamine diphosphorylase/glucosamine-1-phosphate N-acetyltransferase GlmU [Rhodobacter sp.]